MTEDHFIQSLPVLAASPSHPLEPVLSTSGDAFKGLYNPYSSERSSWTLRDGISKAEGFLAACEAVASDLRQAVEPESAEVIRQQVETFVKAWPLASEVDLSSFTAQLVADVQDRQPCHFALRAGLRHVRHTAQALPSIAQTIGAIDAAHTRMRSTTFHANQIPGLLDQARADLAKADAREAADKAARQRAGIAEDEP